MAKQTRLLLFDYDGVLVVPHPSSFSIMREAVSLLINTETVVNWNEVFAQITRETSGTTELRFLTEVAKQLHMPLTEQNSFFDRFYKMRSSLVELDSLRRKTERFDDTYYYEDALKMIEREKNGNSEINTIIGIVTGNPGVVMKKRLPAVLEQYVDFIVGGDEGMSRIDLQKIALKRAEEFGFKPWRATNELRINNAFYFDDVARAVIGGMEVGLQPIYVMRKDVGELAMVPVDNISDISTVLAAEIVNFTQERQSKEIQGKREAHLSLFLTDPKDPDPRIILLTGMNRAFAQSIMNNFSEESARRNMLMVNALDDPRLMHFLNPRTHLPPGEGSLHPRPRPRGERK